MASPSGPDDAELRAILPPDGFVFDRDEFEDTGSIVYYGPYSATGAGDVIYIGAQAVWTPERGLEFDIESDSRRYPLDTVRDFLGDLMQTVCSINYRGMYDGIPDDEGEALPRPCARSLRRRSIELRRDPHRGPRHSHFGSERA